MARAAAGSSLRLSSVGLFGFINKPMTVAFGTSSRSNSSRFAPSTPEMLLKPVTLPPGWLKLATNPSLTGSPPAEKTIGLFDVAALAARVAALPTWRKGMSWLECHTYLTLTVY